MGCPIRFQQKAIVGVIDASRTRDALRRGLSLPRRAVRRLAQVGIFAKPDVSLEHQHLARRYVIRGVESGGAIEEIGRYVSFAGDQGEPLTYLHPIDAVGVNGLHAVVVAPVLVRVEMFRAGRTCELLITKHWPGYLAVGKRPALESSLLFRGVHGYLEIEPGWVPRNRAWQKGQRRDEFAPAGLLFPRW